MQKLSEEFGPAPTIDPPAYTADSAKTHKTLPKFYKNKNFALVGVVAVAVIGLTIFAVLSSHKSTPTEETTTSQIVANKEFGVAVGLVEGVVEYSEDAKNWKPLTAETDLTEGNRVRTANDSRAVLLIDDGSAVRMSGSSEVTLTSLNTDSIVVTNNLGEVYNRVTASETREYKVVVNENTYKAKGTAYRTFNREAKKGVEVFQSSVEFVSDKTEVPEGSYYYTKHEQTDKQGAVLALDIEALKDDSFLKWNSEEDKKVSEFASKLGILTEIDKPKVTPTPTSAPTPKPTASSGIVLSGTQSEYSVVFSWKVSGIDTSKGFKLVRSSKTTAPTYPDNTVTYIEAGKTSYTLYVGDDTKYSYRLCAYKEKTCESYSNTVSVATLKKVKEQPQAGPVSLSLSGNDLSWTIGGTAPYGYKIVIGTVTGPTIESNIAKYYTDSTNYGLNPAEFTSDSNYYIKVCKYYEGTCSDYSNEVIYTP